MKADQTTFRTQRDPRQRLAAGAAQLHHKTNHHAELHTRQDCSRTEQRPHQDCGHNTSNEKMLEYIIERLSRADEQQLRTVLVFASRLIG